MSVVLARIDDRLIHGQVIVGWSQKLRPDRIVLANDAVAADSWQSRVYASTVPPHIQIAILSLDDAVDQLVAGEAWAADRNLVLTASPGDMAALVAGGLDHAAINVGGMHFADGKREMLPFVFVDQTDLAALNRLLEMGRELFAQQVPGAGAVTLSRDRLRDMEAMFS